jgi:Zn-dependent peptidase ImmA (M78 family)
MTSLGVSFLPYEKIAAHATRFLADMGYEDTIPVPVEEIIEFDLRLNIVPIPNLQRDFEIEGFTASDMSAMYVDEYVYLNRPLRYRFTLAHELGHYVMRSDIFKRFKFNSVASWKDFLNKVDPREYSSLEYQGYAFGGLLLVPPDHLEKLFYENLESVTPLIEQVKTEGIARSDYLGYAKDTMATILAKSFEVSTDVIIKRIELDSLEEAIP